MWYAVLFVTFGASPSIACCGRSSCQHAAAQALPTPQLSGSGTLCESANFHVESRSPHCDARTIADCCESWRRHLQTKWLGAKASESWTPRCTIVIHAHRQSYRAAIGRGGEQSFGSSLIDSKDGQISTRRIDLLCDQRGTITALGHELTHVVIADAFPDGRPPAWANEGAAVLADAGPKQQLHQRDLDQSLQRQAAFHCAELLQLADYPAPHRIPAFYGQSASLIKFLSDQAGSEKLIPFLKDAAHRGYDLALREHYALQGLADLHQRWLTHN